MRWECQESLDIPLGTLSPSKGGETVGLGGFCTCYCWRDVVSDYYFGGMALTF